MLTAARMIAVQINIIEAALNIVSIAPIYGLGMVLEILGGFG